METFGEGHLLTKGVMEWFYSLYLPKSGDQRAFPLHASAKGMCPSIIATAGLDPLQDQGRRIAAKLVDGVDEAIAHIRRYGSNHTESILTENDATAARFFQRLDSAILMRNASTQFADGGEFGMGGEIGIATGKLHARGPVGAEQLCSFKYLVTGDGTIRS